MDWRVRQERKERNVLDDEEVVTVSAFDVSGRLFWLFAGMGRDLCFG